MNLPSPALLAALGLLALTAAAPSASAQVITAIDQGNYDQFGFSDPTFTGYVAGIFDTNPEYRNFFVFDRSSIHGPITSATLQIYNPAQSSDFVLAGYVSNSPTETYSLFDVSTPLTGLLAGTSNAFADLGSGTLFGRTIVTPADNGLWLSISLNDAFLSALNSTSGSIAIGGALTTLNSPTGMELIFADSGDGPMAQLLVTVEEASPVPEPSTYGLLGAGALLVGITLRRRLRTR